MRVAVEHGHQRRRPFGGQQLAEDVVRALLEAGARPQRAEQQVGAGHADHVDLVAEHVGRRQQLRQHRAHAHQRHARVPGGAAQRIAAGQHELALGIARQLLVDRPCGQAQVGGLAVRAPEPRQRVQERPLQVAPEGGLPRGAAGLADADRRRDDRLVRAALGRQRHAARRAHQDRLAAGVHAERPRLQRAPHERVVDRADRQQRLAVAAPGGAQLAQQAHEVGLGDAQLDVAARGRLVPVHERLRIVGEPVAPLSHRPDAALVDPAAQVGGAGHVGAERDHPLRHLGRLVDEVDEEAPERLLGRLRAAVLAPERGRHRRRLARRGLLAGEGGGRGGAQLALRAGRVERGPGIVGVGAQRAGQLEHLLAREQRGVVLRVALHRQRPALDRVGEHHRRAVAVHGAVGLDQLGGVVAAEVAQPGPQLAVAQLHHEPLERGVVAGQALAQLLRGGAQQALVLLVGHLVDAPAQLGPAGQLEQRVQPRAVLDVDHLPARGLEHVGPAPEGDVGHHAVERLAVEVHHPQHLAELGHAGVGHRLPDRALVELGVAHEGDLAAHRRRLEAVVLEVAARERAPDRGGGADAHRAGRVVHRVGVLGAAGVALQAAERAQRLEVGALEAAQQVVDRVQHRRGVRLDRHAVLGAQLREPERAHEAHHRGARRLVAAHLHAGAVLAHAVGVVDDGRGEPQHAPLDRSQRVEIRRRGRRRRRRCGPCTTQVVRSSHPSRPEGSRRACGRPRRSPGRG